MRRDSAEAELGRANWNDAVVNCWGNLVRTAPASCTSSPSAFTWTDTKIFRFACRLILAYSLAQFLRSRTGVGGGGTTWTMRQEGGGGGGEREISDRSGFPAPRDGIQLYAPLSLSLSLSLALSLSLSLSVCRCECKCVSVCARARACVSERASAPLRECTVEYQSTSNAPLLY
jgi:hypothetical protein